MQANPCQNGVLEKAPPGLPDQQRQLGTSSGAYFGGFRGAGAEVKTIAQFLQENAHIHVRGTGCTVWGADFCDQFYDCYLLKLIRFSP
eukprot:1161182-Pelagomonas_calceolata.AAC.18